MKFISNPERSTWQALTQRPTADFSSIEPTVDEVFAAVRSNGDAAVRKYSQKFDAYTPDQLMIAPQALANAKGELSAELVAAIDVAYENIYRFHEAQKTAPVRLDTQEGVSCWQEKTHRESGDLHSRRNCTAVFNCANAGHSCTTGWL